MHVATPSVSDQCSWTDNVMLSLMATSWIACLFGILVQMHPKEYINSLTLPTKAVVVLFRASSLKLKSVLPQAQECGTWSLFKTNLTLFTCHALSSCSDTESIPSSSAQIAQSKVLWRHSPLNWKAKIVVRKVGYPMTWNRHQLYMQAGGQEISTMYMHIFES